MAREKGEPSINGVPISEILKPAKSTPWEGWHPTTGQYDPNDTHFNPCHPAPGTPDEVLADFLRTYGEDLPEDVIQEAISDTELPRWTLKCSLVQGCPNWAHKTQYACLQGLALCWAVRVRRSTPQVVQ